MNELTWAGHSTDVRVPQIGKMPDHLEHWRRLIDDNGSPCRRSRIWSEHHTVNREFANKFKPRIIKCKQVHENHTDYTLTLAPPAVGVEFACEIGYDLEDQGRLVGGERFLDAPHELSVELLDTQGPNGTTQYQADGSAIWLGSLHCHTLPSDAVCLARQAALYNDQPTRPSRTRRKRVAGQLSNRALVLEAIRTHAPISRIELAQLTGLTAATITNIVRPLLSDGLVTEVGHSESTGGKRRTLLEINHEARYALGVQFGRGSIAIALSNLWGAVVGRSRSRSPATTDPNDMVARMAAAANDLVDSLGIDQSALVGAGVAAPGPLDHKLGALGAARNLPGWHGFPLREQFSRAAGVPTTLHHDAIAAAAGEAWSGAARSSKSLAVVYMDVGIGAGLILNGIPVAGSSGNAGEFGHLVVDSGGPICRCGGRGCLEAVAGPHAVESAFEALTGRRQSFSRIGTAALAEEPTSLSLMRRSAEAMSVAVLSVANVLDIDQVILAGPGFGDIASLYVQTIAARLDEEFATRDSHGIRVGISLNMRDAAAVGASVLALRAHLS